MKMSVRRQPGRQKACLKRRICIASRNEQRISSVPQPVTRGAVRPAPRSHAGVGIRREPLADGTLVVAPRSPLVAHNWYDHWLPLGVVEMEEDVRVLVALQRLPAPMHSGSALVENHLPRGV